MNTSQASCQALLLPSTLAVCKRLNLPAPARFHALSLAKEWGTLITSWDHHTLIYVVVGTCLDSLNHALARSLVKLPLGTSNEEPDNVLAAHMVYSAARDVMGEDIEAVYPFNQLAASNHQEPETDAARRDLDSPWWTLPSYMHDLHNRITDTEFEGRELMNLPLAETLLEMVFIKGGDELVLQNGHRFIGQACVVVLDSIYNVL